MSWARRGILGLEWLVGEVILAEEGLAQDQATVPHICGWVCRMPAAAKEAAEIGKAEGPVLVDGMPEVVESPEERRTPTAIVLERINWARILVGTHVRGSCRARRPSVAVCVWA